MNEGVPPGTYNNSRLQENLPSLDEIRAFRQRYLQKTLAQKKLLHSESFVRMVHEEFEQFDITNDGALDREELNKYVEEHYAHGSQEYLDGVFDTFDRDNDGVLSEAEFRECVGVLKQRWGSKDSPSTSSPKPAPSPSPRQSVRQSTQQSARQSTQSRHDQAESRP